ITAPDTIAPIAGELVFTDFIDSGVSSVDGISNDASFDLSIQGHEQNTSVEYQYSIDGSATWFVLNHQFDQWGDGKNYFKEGTYSFRAKVTDYAGNESYTDIKNITLDLSLPDLKSVLNYDPINDPIIFNAPTDAYEVYKWVNTEWQLTTLSKTLGWDSAKYKVVATDIAGNTAEQIFNIGLVIGNYQSADHSEVSILKGTEATDWIYGGLGNDILLGGGGQSFLYGEEGDDILNAQGGSTSALRGGAGNDTYIFDRSDVYKNSNQLITIDDSK
ncbi:Ig-like domain-containing protein, partial [Acinetobacter sichuanensis]